MDTDNKKQLTAEQIKRIEINRLKAKEKLAEKRKQRENKIRPIKSASSNKPVVLPVGGRINNGIKNDKNSKEQVNDDNNRPINSKWLDYIEYDFSKMKDSKGGFVDENNGVPEGKSLEEWEKLHHRPTEPTLSFDVKEAPKCFECGSPEIDPLFNSVFKSRVCRYCKEKFPEKYSLLTKTECKQDYLLTEPELRDEELLCRLERPNPHKSTYNNMLLFLRYQVEEYAFKRWGGQEEMDKEWERRENMKKEKKEQKFLNRIKEMKKKTRTSTWNKGVKKHVHEFVTNNNNDLAKNEMGTVKKTCSSCGLEIEEFVF